MRDRLDDLELHHLRALDALLHTRSVTRAAARLGLTQSAVSHTLAHLRAALGDELLTRGPGGLQPTPLADAMHEPLQHALNALRRALSATSWDPATSTRRFVVTMADSFTLTLVPALIARFADEAPHAELDVRPPTRGGTEAGVGSADVDAALIVGKPDLTGLHIRRVLEERFVSLLRADHPALADGVDLDRFCALPHALVTTAAEGPGVVDRALAALGRSRQVRLRIGYFLAAPLVVAASDLILTLPRRVGLHLATLAPLAVVETPLALPTFHADLVWPTRLHADPGHRWLREAIVDAIDRT